MYIGIDIGGTKCAVSGADIVDGKLNIVHKYRMETPAGMEPEKVTNLLMDEILKWNEKMDAVGISCGGPLNSEKGIILSPPNLPGWDEVEIVRMVEEKLHTSAFLQNDANAGALAEWLFGAGKGKDDVIFLTFGTGMGAGLVLNGKLYEGKQCLAGEAGHVRLSSFGPSGFGKSGSFEGFCSGGGIAQLAENAVRVCRQTGKTTALETTGAMSAKWAAECARNGDAPAIEVFHICGRMLGSGLAVLVDLLNPEMIILGSIYGRCQELLEPSMREVLAEECLPAALENCQIVPALLGEQIGDFAALSCAIYGDKVKGGR